MIKAGSAKVGWDPAKKAWLVRIQVGEEVIKRPLKKPIDADESLLRSMALEAAKEEGYEVDPASVSVVR